MVQPYSQQQNQLKQAGFLLVEKIKQNSVAEISAIVHNQEFPIDFRIKNDMTALMVAACEGNVEGVNEIFRQNYLNNIFFIMKEN